jgi:hypothetical protein
MIAPMRFELSGSVTVTPGSISVAGSPSVYPRFVGVVVTTGGSLSQVTVTETVAIDPPLSV